MGSLQGEIESSLNELRRMTATDFAALSLADFDGQSIRWRYASGNRNERYKRIVLRIGKGIAGKVLKSGRPMILNSMVLKRGDDPREFPIMLAENLKSIVGGPVVINKRVQGVLLVGSRVDREFDEDTVELVMNFAEQLGTMIQQKGGQTDATVRPISIYRNLGNHKSL